MQIAKDINKTWVDRISVILRRSYFKAAKAWVCGIKSACKSISKIIGYLN